jgi:hypothetical protein
MFAPPGVIGGMGELFVHYKIHFSRYLDVNVLPTTN